MKKTFSHFLRGSLFLVLILACGISLAQFNPVSPIPTDPSVKKGKLPNGLTYYIRKNAIPEKKAQLRLVVNVGSVLEDADQQGLAHFMEHMNFNGSKNFPKNELVNYLQNIGVEFGADLNAYTGFDETVYILPIPTDDPSRIEKGFTVLEDWAVDNLFWIRLKLTKREALFWKSHAWAKGPMKEWGDNIFPSYSTVPNMLYRLPIGKDSILKSFQTSHA